MVVLIFHELLCFMGVFFINIIIRTNQQKNSTFFLSKRYECAKNDLHINKYQFQKYDINVDLLTFIILSYLIKPYIYTMLYKKHSK